MRSKDEEFIINNYKSMTMAEMADALFISLGSVMDKLALLRSEGLIEYKKRPWTDAERQFIKTNLDEMTIEVMAVYLGRSMGSICAYIHSAGLERKVRRSGVRRIVHDSK